MLQQALAVSGDQNTLPTEAAAAACQFVPKRPRSPDETGLAEAQIHALTLKWLLARRVARGVEIAAALRLPLEVIAPALARLQHDRLVAYKNTAGHDDFVYELLDAGAHRARDLQQECGYVGPAPVVLEDYTVAMDAQSVRRQRPTLEVLRRAYADLVVGDRLLARLGQAIRAASALFLYGKSGNGKTSLAERISDCFGAALWIPRAVVVDGQIVRLFDPKLHEPLAADEQAPPSAYDRRWVQVRRPAIVVGGELTLSNLELAVTSDRVIEAPLQMKSNGGTLVVDDFGRQRMPPAELLNRWIVPLEKGHDILNLPGGRMFQVPFDQVLVFATNLEPRELVDEAFLRRIPYKLEIHDPTETEFRELLIGLAQQQGIQVADGAVDYLLARHFRQPGRALRFCHPRDLLRQVRGYCEFYGAPLEFNVQSIDAAVENYFAVV